MTDLVFIIIILLIVLGGVIIFKKSEKDKKQDESIINLERRLTDLMTGQLKEIRGSVDSTSRAMQSQISSFTKETTAIRERIKQMHEKVKDVSSFQELFKAPKIRGGWGETNLNYLLKEHFSQKLYQSQHLFSSGEQVDFVIKLPNGKLLPIDSKFPSTNFSKMTETENEEERERFKKKFLEDVKFKIKQISSKYILPSENTVDFALMYVPAEAIYYEINVKNSELAEFAQSKKVILVSPNTLFLSLSAIQHWFKDTQISQQTQEILKRLTRVQEDGKKLMDDFRKLGSHLKNAYSAYENSEKRVSLFGSRIKKLLENKKQ